MMAAAAPLQRDLAFTLDGRCQGTSVDPLGGGAGRRRTAPGRLPPSVAGLIEHGVIAADTVECPAFE